MIGAGAAFIAGALPMVCLLGIGALIVGLYGLQRLSGGAAIGLWLFCLVAGFTVALYRPMEFDYPVIHFFSSLDFTLYLNVGKALAGLAVFIWLWRAHPSPKNMALSCALASGAIVAVLGVAHWVFGVGWAIKWPDGIIWFALINAGATVLAEEAFFRLLLQNKLASLLPLHYRPRLIAALVATLVFALAHAPPTHPSFLLFLWAGGLYAWVYAATGRFSMALLTHFGVNILHFTLLRYPL
ncbi:CPBP family intramembrane glutamic endopeptidase [Gilvimarinus xylanilyticus]|uniref:CPBP family intramembrane metalloprotease n=1 Tax=Gilvimarinus xylanilyticus TaxID=2944139 RepID=A0A9X2KTR5_9GAMM|nr:type II CAAX endopeptidase family protein [Gilvimarinus xylanilyticus]MCP8899564.1 CPBP family intramembrane metalloprotease [Gilvimarinus xylanilyticus]